jgi:predicted DCC family thiol-disulfide oxidoreductase YuxK
VSQRLDTNLIMIYDGECGICQALRRWAEARDTARRMRFVPNQTADLDTLSPGLTRAMAAQTVIAVRSDGRRWHGARAIFEMLRRLPGIWRLIGVIGALPVIRWLAEPFYRIVAHHRARLSRWVGLAACGVEMSRK